MTEPIGGITFSTVATHALPALADGFFCIMDGGFQKHLERYDANKVDSVMQTLIEQMAETLSKQRGVQYEFGPAYEEYCAKKYTGILEQTHLKPFKNIFRRKTVINSHWQ